MEPDARLDGNAVAGLLAEIFGVEMTVSVTTCANCGAQAPIGALHVYMRAPGIVIRCSACGEVQIKIVRGRETFVLDLSGVQRIEVRAEL